jgi:hypothetical protein
MENILSLYLDYHPKFQALEGDNPINIKTNQPWSNILLF